MAERITFETNDHVTIVGDWYPVPTLAGAVVLVHMMPETRASWALFQRALSKKNLASLAIDLRGHGESTAGQDGAALDYKEFSDEMHQSSIWDVMGACDWLRSRGIETRQIALAGASIGSHVCLQQLANEPVIPGALLLSPGENYHGIVAIEEIEKLGGDQSLLIASSEEDAESFTASKKLFDLAPVRNKTFLPYKGAGHGTSIFAADVTLLDKGAKWLFEVISGV